MNSINSESIITEMESRKFFFNPELIFNYFNCLKTKPFLILTGISGSGKSKLSQIFSDIISEDDKTKLELIPVKPNWKDSKGLFGYHNLLNDTYYITPLIKLMIRALNDPDNPHFLILDEMNLAKTEHYFSDYLSLIESRQLVTIQEKISTYDVNELSNKFKYPDSLTTSEAIILSAIDIDRDEFLKIETYRENIFSKQYKKQLSTSESYWKNQYRTEINRKDDSRLASRVFERHSSKRGYYKLRDKSTLTVEDRETFEKLEKFYKKFKNGKHEIFQDLITLHNNNVCISSCNNIACSLKDSCTYSNEEKYKCPNLYHSDSDTYLVPPKIPIPLNLFTIGTVNIDETTYMFSPKVLDRANVIELNDVDFENLLDLDADLTKILEENSNSIWDEKFYFDADTEIKEYKIDIPNTENAKNFIIIYENGFKDILKIFNILKGYNMHFGYRTMNEMSLFIQNINESTSYLNKLQIALDLQILQKILPKFHGSFEKLWNPLFNILLVCIENIPEDFANRSEYTSRDIYSLISIITDLPDNNNLNLNRNILKDKFKYPRSARKILFMMKNLEMHGFSSYIE